MARQAGEPTPKRTTTVERVSERELVIRRTFDGPARIVFAAWTKPELFRRWWVPRSCVGITLVSCEMDVRTGGGYRLVFSAGGAEQAFYGKYLEVVPNARLVWTNEEDPSGPITTVTFEEIDGTTRVVVHELHPSKEALDEARASGSEQGMVEAIEQLDELLVELVDSAA